MTMTTLFGALISSAIIENLLFARAIGADHIINRSRSYRFILYFGFGVAAVSCLAMMPLWWLGQALGKAPWWAYARSMSALLLVAAASLLLTFAAAMSGRLRPMRLIDQGASYSASLAIVLLAMGVHLSLLESIVYCFGASAGLAAAMVLVHAGRDRLALCRLPRSFSGLPITMVYIGILSLAIYGLIGHQLPT